MILFFSLFVGDDVSVFLLHPWILCLSFFLLSVCLFHTSLSALFISPFLPSLSSLF